MEDSKCDRVETKKGQWFLIVADLSAEDLDRRWMRRGETNNYNPGIVKMQIIANAENLK